MKLWPAVIVVVTCGQVFQEGQKVHKDAGGDAVEKISHVACQPALNSAHCGKVHSLKDAGCSRHNFWLCTQMVKNQKRTNLALQQRQTTI